MEEKRGWRGRFGVVNGIYRGDSLGEGGVHRDWWLGVTSAQPDLRD